MRKNKKTTTTMANGSTLTVSAGPPLIVNGALLPFTPHPRSRQVFTPRTIGALATQDTMSQIKTGYEGLHRLDLLVRAMWSCDYNLVVDPEVRAVKIHLANESPDDSLNTDRLEQFALIGVEDVTVYWTDSTSDDGSGRKPHDVPNWPGQARPVNPQMLEILRLRDQIESMKKQEFISDGDWAVVEAARAKLLERRA